MLIELENDEEIEVTELIQNKTANIATGLQQLDKITENSYMKLLYKGYEFTINYKLQITEIDGKKTDEKKDDKTEEKDDDKMYLYNKGDKCTDYSSGWDYIGGRYYNGGVGPSTVTFNSDNIEFYNGGYIGTILNDDYLNQYKYLCIKSSSQNLRNYYTGIQVGCSSDFNNYSDSNAWGSSVSYCFVVDHGDNTTWNDEVKYVDIQNSISQTSRYLEIIFAEGRDANVTEIYLTNTNTNEEEDLQDFEYLEPNMLYSGYGEGELPKNAFISKPGEEIHWSVRSFGNAYIGYDFEKKSKLVKCIFYPLAYPEGVCVKNYKIQASNNNVDWEDITDVLTASNNGVKGGKWYVSTEKQEIKSFKTTESYRYYRVFILDSYQGAWQGLGGLQFWCE